jgi:hypothetical protein
MLYYITVCLLHSVTVHDVAHNTKIRGGTQKFPELLKNYLKYL